MRFMQKILLLLGVLLSLEIYTVALVADGLGLPATLLIFVLTIIIGGRLVKQEGVATLHNMVTKLQKGAAIDQDFAEGALLLIAGFLFIFPGFISDVLGLLLLLPPVRRLVASLLSASLQRKFAHLHADLSSRGYTIIDGESAQEADPPGEPVLQLPAPEKQPPR
ncbi:MAG: FxsA family protein [Magnetococcus sp. XQGC-1]